MIEIISQARGEKTNNNVSLKTPIKNLNLKLSKELNDAINASIKDFKATLFIENLNVSELAEGNYEVEKIELEKRGKQTELEKLELKKLRIQNRQQRKLNAEQRKKDAYEQREYRDQATAEFKKTKHSSCIIPYLITQKKISLNIIQSCSNLTLI